MMLFAGGAAFCAIAALARFAPAVPARPPRWAIPLVVAAAAAGGAATDGAATGVSGLDALLRAALAGLTAAGGSVAPLAALWAAVASAAAMLVVRSPADGLAGAALGAALAERLSGTTGRLVGAVVAGGAAQVALRFEDADTTGVPSALAVAVMAPVLVAGWGHVPRTVRRRAVWAAAGAGGWCLVAGGLAAGAAARSTDDISAATSAAQRGVDLLGDDDEGATAALRDAAGRFEEVRERFDAWWARPARVVPFVAQQTRAVRTMAAVGSDLSVAAADAAGVDLDRIRPQDGVVDLAAVEEALVPVREADRVLDSAVRQLAAIRSPWLLAPVDDRRVRLDGRVTDAAATAELATAVGDILPDLLGADAPRRYLLLVQQPAEARGSGGLPGNFGEIVADDGRLDLVDFGRIADLDARMPPFAERSVETGAGHRTLYGYGFHDLLWQNTTLDPDFTVAADVSRQMWAMTGAEPVDGVLSIDPFAIRALLEVVGPLTLSDGTQLGPDNALPFLLNEQYAALDDTATRVDLLGDAAELGWDALTAGALPGPRALATAFGPAVQGRHLAFVTFDDDERPVLERLGLAGATPTPVGDGVGIVTVNLGQNKIDYFLQRTSVYEARWDPGTGAVEGTYTVELANRAPTEGQPDAVIGFGGPLSTDPNLAPGENFLQAYVYTAMPPVAVRVDGADSARSTLPDDAGWYVTTFPVRIPAGGTVSIEVLVAGAVVGDSWAFEAVRQPPINDDGLIVDLVVEGSSELAVDGLVDGGDALHGEFPLDRPARAEVRLR